MTFSGVFTHRGRRSAGRSGVALTAAALMMGAVAGCGGSSEEESGAGSDASAEAPKVALLMPDTDTARYEARDRPTFEAALAEKCPDCELLYSNGDADMAKQQSQAEAALTNGADVLVIDSIDTDAAASIVTRAKQANVPVVAYDRLVNDAEVDYVVKFDNTQQGVVQGESLVARLAELGDEAGPIVMMNGAANDANSKPLKNGAHSILDESPVKIAREYDTPGWNPAEAQSQMEQALTAIGADKIKGVLAANDGLASGAIAALKGAGVDPLPPVTGLDADLAAVQRILRGEQYMTVYLDVEKEARTAAAIAAALAQGEEVPADLITGSLNNGLKDVPGALLETTPVTLEDIKPVLIDSGYLKAAEVCTGNLKSKCAEAGID